MWAQWRRLVYSFIQHNFCISYDFIILKRISLEEKNHIISQTQVLIYNTKIDFTTNASNVVTSTMQIVSKIGMESDYKKITKLKWWRWKVGDVVEFWWRCESSGLLRTHIRSLTTTFELKYGCWATSCSLSEASVWVHQTPSWWRHKECELGDVKNRDVHLRRDWEEKVKDIIPACDEYEIELPSFQHRKWRAPLKCWKDSYKEELRYEKELKIKEKSCQKPKLEEENLQNAKMRKTENVPSSPPCIGGGRLNYMYLFRITLQTFKLCTL